MFSHVRDLLQCLTLPTVRIHTHIRQLVAVHVPSRDLLHRLPLHRRRRSVLCPNRPRRDSTLLVAQLHHRPLRALRTAGRVPGQGIQYHCILIHMPPQRPPHLPRAPETKLPAHVSVAVVVVVVVAVIVVFVGGRVGKSGISVGAYIVFECRVHSVGSFISRSHSASLLPSSPFPLNPT